MIKIFKNYVFNIFIVVTFSLSQVVNVNANQLRNSTQKDNISVSVMEKMKNTSPTATKITALSVPAISYGTTSKNPIEGKIEKVVLVETIGVGLFYAGYVLSLIGLMIGPIKDIIQDIMTAAKSKTVDSEGITTIWLP
ncbi:hypothetical protein MEC_00760 [Bartonella alsatica IBS 382]|uniref:Uncharacterized protein n=2 Tax=Bartonella alsatica TaxID=52764 RepID=J0PYH3_9HYPH|nr:hypothetical protein MEC_00760 [Bartonella alsatica IBS 382]